MKRGAQMTLSAAAWLLASSHVHAYSKCVPFAAKPHAGHWPDVDNVSAAGTRKWSFDWQVGAEGIEISDVRYGTDPNGAKHPVMTRGSLPLVPAHYPKDAPVCGGPPTGFTDTLSLLDEFHPSCCGEVPVTICSLPERKLVCDPQLGALDTSACPSGSSECNGVCIGTQTDSALPIEDGVGELASVSPEGDVVLSASFALGFYQFVQRWRFLDDGRIVPSIRLGGLNNCQYHSHQVYWRFNFALVDGAPAETVQQCDDGNCPDDTAERWSANMGCTCGLRPCAATSWRVGDRGAPDRHIVIDSGVTEGVAESFCEGTQNASDCPGGCTSTHDFCALAASEPHESLYRDKCDDKLADATSVPACAGVANGGDVAFWYFAHPDHHNPCSDLAMCVPDLGTVAFGPTLRLSGTW